MANVETVNYDWHTKAGRSAWKQAKIKAKEVLKVWENQHRQVQPHKKLKRIANWSLEEAWLEVKWNESVLQEWEPGNGIANEIRT